MLFRGLFSALCPELSKTNKKKTQLLNAEDRNQVYRELVQFLTNSLFLVGYECFECWAAMGCGWCLPKSSMCTREDTLLVEGRRLHRSISQGASLALGPQKALARWREVQVHLDMCPVESTNHTLLWVQGCRFPAGSLNPSSLQEARGGFSASALYWPGLGELCPPPQEPLDRPLVARRWVNSASPGSVRARHTSGQNS